jgi:hypothetical protein
LRHLLERTHLDLPDTLTRDTVDLAQLSERLGWIAETPLSQDVALAVAEARYSAF